MTAAIFDMKAIKDVLNKRGYKPIYPVEKEAVEPAASPHTQAVPQCAYCAAHNIETCNGGCWSY